MKILSYLCPYFKHNVSFCGVSKFVSFTFPHISTKKKKKKKNWACKGALRLRLRIIGLDCLAIFNKIFLVLFSSFELHIIWLNRLSTSILFDWTVPVAVHWLNSFSNCTEFDRTVYQVIYFLLNRSPNRVCWICH